MGIDHRFSQEPSSLLRHFEERDTSDAEIPDVWMRLLRFARNDGATETMIITRKQNKEERGTDLES